MIYQTIFKELNKIVDLNKLQELEHLKFTSKGFMDLNFDFLRIDEQDRHIIAISHYYKQNGDMISDPDMEIRIDHSRNPPTCEALTYQDSNLYQEIYPIVDNVEMVNPIFKQSLNNFLLYWIKKIQRQDFKEEDQQEYILKQVNI